MTKGCSGGNFSQRFYAATSLIAVSCNQKCFYTLFGRFFPDPYAISYREERRGPLSSAARDRLTKKKSGFYTQFECKTHSFSSSVGHSPQVGVNHGTGKQVQSGSGFLLAALMLSNLLERTV